MHNRRWTPVEDRVLRHNVTLCGDNISAACEMTAPLIGRTPKACCYRWYDKLAKEVDTSGMNFSLLGVETEIKNKKNKLRRNSNKKNKKKTNFIKRLLNKLFS